LLLVAAGCAARPYQAEATRIIVAARADRGAWDKLAFLTDRIGNRLSGSAALEAAVAWAQTALAADGHEAVRAEPVSVPHWVRGSESAAVVAPIARPLHVLGLGSTPGTPAGGVTAPLVVVRTWEELARLDDDAVRGRIVLFDHPMTGTGYDAAVPYRTLGPGRAAARGAVAALVRSVTARSLASPHTGDSETRPGAPLIPAAALAVEDAELLVRLAAAGEVRVHLELGARTLPDAPSANVIAELRGRERPDEIVVIAAHLDSWDVGQGAHDDGAGVATVMQALTTLRRLRLVPRRTVRVVLYTNEENGLAGARAYARAHAAELGRHVAELEADSGGFRPRGLAFDVDRAHEAAARARLAEVVALLAPLGADHIEADSGGADIAELAAAQVPTLGLAVDESTYFDVHHTEADTLDKVEPAALAEDVAAVAIAAYVLAEMPDALPRTAGRGD
jgi:Iap family predicted aminopeptidase